MFNRGQDESFDRPLENPMTTLIPFAIPIQAPVTANSVDWPLVTYGERTTLNFPLDDSEEENPGWGRVTFEKFDALRICRGEYMPYEVRCTPENPYSWAWTVANSPWLAERYAYEKKHYGSSYGFGGDVNEMINEFSHYLFCFHDQYVEVLCAGLWFETSPLCLRDRPPGDDHASHNLPESTTIHRIGAHGITCQIRKNPKSFHTLLADAALGTQKLYQFAAELDGIVSVDFTLNARVRHEKLYVTLVSHFGKVIERYDEVPLLSALRPHIDAWLLEVANRRENMRHSQF